MTLTESLGALVVPAVAYLLYLARVWLLAHTAPKQYAALAGLAQTAVQAAEQAGAALNLPGSSKFDLATAAIVATAKRLGIKVKPEEAQAFIDQAVLALKQEQRYEEAMKAVTT